MSEAAIQRRIDNLGQRYYDGAIIPMRANAIDIHPYATWSKNGITVAGGNEAGIAIHQIYWAYGFNHRVAKWELGAKQGIVVAGGQGQENSLTQLDGPQGVVVDQLGTVYVTDYNNNRIMGWSKGATQGIVIAGKGYGAEPNQINWIVPVVYHSIGVVISMSSTSEILEYKNLTLNKLNLGVGVGVFRMDFLRFKATYDAFRLLLRQSSSGKLRI
ncbi:unnamed protein product [Rotaria socialis]